MVRVETHFTPSFLYSAKSSRLIFPWPRNVTPSHPAARSAFSRDGISLYSFTSTLYAFAQRANDVFSSGRTSNAAIFKIVSSFVSACHRRYLETVAQSSALIISVTCPPCQYTAIKPAAQKLQHICSFQTTGFIFMSFLFHHSFNRCLQSHNHLVHICLLDDKRRNKADDVGTGADEYQMLL